MYGEEARESRTGRWSEEEKAAFSEGLKLYGKDWKKISSLVKTRSLTQIRTHAQKFFKRDTSLSKQPLSSLPPGSIGANKVVSHNSTQKAAAPIGDPHLVHVVTNGENEGRSSGRWSEQEQQAFMEGLRKYGKDWKAISQIVKTRSLTQIRTHAQKFFKKGAKDTPMKRSAEHACLAHNPAFNSNSYSQGQHGGRYTNFATAMPMTMSMSLVTDFTKDTHGVAGKRHAAEILIGSQSTSALATVATAQLESEQQQQQQQQQQQRPSKKLKVCSPSGEALDRQAKPTPVPPQIEITPKNSVAQQAGFGDSTKSDLSNVSPVVISKQAIDLSSVDGRKPAARSQHKPKPTSSPTPAATTITTNEPAADDDAADVVYAHAGDNASAHVGAEPTPLDRCGEILAQLTQCRHVELFLRPVDPVALNIPDYLQVIDRPMDLGTVRQKLGLSDSGTGGASDGDGGGGGHSRASRSRRGTRERQDTGIGNAERMRKCEYGSAEEFAADVRLVFENAQRYNGDGHPVAQWAGDILSTFERKWAQMTQQRQASPKSKMKATSSKPNSTRKSPKTLAKTLVAAAPETTPATVITVAPAPDDGTAVSKVPSPRQENTAARVSASSTSRLRSATRRTVSEMSVADSIGAPTSTKGSHAKMGMDGPRKTRATPRRVSPRKEATAAIAAATAAATAAAAAAAAAAATTASIYSTGKDTNTATAQHDAVQDDKPPVEEGQRTDTTAELVATQSTTVTTSSAKPPVTNAKSSNDEAERNDSPDNNSNSVSSADTSATSTTSLDADAKGANSDSVHAPIGNPSLHNASDYSAVEAMMQMVNGHSLGTRSISGSSSGSGTVAAAFASGTPPNWPSPAAGSGIDQLTWVMDSRSSVTGDVAAGLGVGMGMAMGMGMGMDTSATPLGRHAAAWLRMSPQEQQQVLHLLDAPVHVYYFGQYLREHKPSVLRLLLFVADLHKMHGDVQFLMQQSQREHRVHSQHESKQSTLTHMHNFHKYIVAAYFRADSTNSLCGICPGLDKYSANQAVEGNTIIVDCVYRTALAMLHQWLQPYTQSEECKAAVAPPNKEQ